MKIAIISDIHDNFHNLVSAIEEMENRNVEYVLCLGDAGSNGVARILAGLKIPVFMVWGNNTGDQVQIMRTSLAPGSSLNVSDKTYDLIELGGRNIFLSHYPDLTELIAASGEFDAVFFGHTHRKFQEKIGNCLTLNPGELGAVVAKEASFAVYDTDRNEAELIVVKDAVIVRTEKVDRYLGEV